jgi:general secretion pathway protein G
MPRCTCGGPQIRVTVARSDINGPFKSALDQYKVDNGSYPRGLENLVQQADEATNWQGPYFESPKLPVDPWGNNYIYQFPGTHGTNFYDLVSAGPDGKVGTKDDIVNW